MIRFAARAALALLLAWSAAAPAQTLSDPHWESVLEAGRMPELEQLARTRLQAQPDDPQGSLALALVAVASGHDGQVEAALAQAERCLQRQPQAGVCHYAVGSLLGVQAVNGGLMKAMTLVGRIKSAFARAVELDPLYFDAREGLLQFYLLAPGIAGGSVDSARELAAAAQAHQPEYARILRAEIAMHEGQWQEAERELAAVKAGDDAALRASLRNVWNSLGAQYLRDKQLAKARTAFERVAHDAPQWALGFYGLGRTMLESGAADDAIAAFDRARGLLGADLLPIDYRQALAWLAKGDKAHAKPLLERFVAQGKGHPMNLDDARKRLATLG